MSVSYKAIVNFKTKQVKLKEYGESVVNSLKRYPNGSIDMIERSDLINVWDIQLDFWCEHTKIKHDEFNSLYFGSEINGDSLSFKVYDSLHNVFPVTLKIRTKPFKNWNLCIHPAKNDSELPRVSADDAYNNLAYSIARMFSHTFFTYFSETSADRRYWAMQQAIRSYASIAAPNCVNISIDAFENIMRIEHNYEPPTR